MTGWLIVVLAAFATPALCAELSVEDFDFNGEMGSAGARIERVGPNEFKIEVAPSPGSSDLPPAAPPNLPYINEGKQLWPTRVQFIITRNAKGNKLKLTKYYGGQVQDKEPGINASAAWSYDKMDWKKIYWNKGVMEFPVFQQDTVYLYANPCPMRHDDIVESIRQWEKSPYVKVRVLGQSLVKKLDIHRIEITDPQSPIPRNKKWVHYLAAQHGHENHVRWMLTGMVDWLNGKEGEDARKRSIFHIIIMMNPDGVAMGFIRPNTQGIDTNRSYVARGSNKQKQAHEAYFCQKDLEDIMQSDAPVSALWSTHNGGGTVMNPGKECGTLIGPPEEFVAIIQRNDPTNELKTDWPIARKRGGGDWTWNGGPARQFRQFGMTDFLYEGGPSGTKEQMRHAGGLLAKSIPEYWKGTK